MKSTIAVDVMLGSLMLIILASQTLFFLDKVSAYYSYLFAIKMAEYITMETVHALNQAEIVAVLYNSEIPAMPPQIPKIDVPIFTHINSCTVRLTPIEVDNPTPAKKITNVCTSIAVIIDENLYTITYCDNSIARLQNPTTLYCFP